MTISQPDKELVRFLNKCTARTSRAVLRYDLITSLEDLRFAVESDVWRNIPRFGEVAKAEVERRLGIKPSGPESVSEAELEEMANVLRDNGYVVKKMTREMKEAKRLIESFGGKVVFTE